MVVDHRRRRLLARQEQLGQRGLRVVEFRHAGSEYDARGGETEHGNESPAARWTSFAPHAVQAAPGVVSNQVEVIGTAPPYRCDRRPCGWRRQLAPWSPTLFDVDEPRGVFDRR